jgi:hypothetical protein
MFAPSFWPTPPALRLNAPQRRDDPAVQVMRDSDAAFLRDAAIYRVIVRHDFRVRAPAGDERQDAD